MIWFDFLIFYPKASKFYVHSDVTQLFFLEMWEGPKHNLLGFYSGRAWFLSLQIGKERSKGKRAMQALFFFAKATDTEGLGFALIF